MQLMRDAVAVLQRHLAVKTVGHPVPVDGGVEVLVTISVSLPSRFEADGVSPNGIRADEPAWFVFPPTWPMRAPRLWLREDFPLELPHINPHQAGHRVSPCLFEGSLDEVLHRFGLERIIDQLSNWSPRRRRGNSLTSARVGSRPVEIFLRQRSYSAQKPLSSRRQRTALS